MIAEKMKPHIAGSSVIRAMFEEGKRLAEIYGEENVYDFSIGNPNVPAPKEINQAIIEILKEEDPLKVHGYMNNAGFEETRKAVADDLNSRFKTDYGAENIIMTVGAGSALNVALKSILDADDEIVAISPYFVEYRNYVNNYDGKLVEVAAKEENNFRPDADDIRKVINKKTKAIILNNPNNPTGVVYDEATIENIGKMLEEEAEKIGHPIYIISDEPYRELVYGGREVPFIPNYYDNTIVAYSFSKSLSLPGERIGYLAVSPKSHEAEEFVSTATIANRISGCVNAPSLIQLAIARAMGAKCDVNFYEENGKILYNALTNLGFTCIRPEGAFYLWMKAPSGDDNEFVAKAKKHRILMVPGSAFAGPGFVRISYCVARKTIEDSIESFEKLWEEVGE